MLRNPQAKRPASLFPQFQDQISGPSYPTPSLDATPKRHAAQFGVGQRVLASARAFEGRVGAQASLPVPQRNPVYRKVSLFAWLPAAGPGRPNAEIPTPAPLSISRPCIARPTIPCLANWAAGPTQHEPGRSTKDNRTRMAPFPHVAD